MHNKLTTSWGVIPGREVGTVTKRFHKRRPGTDAERAVSKALGVKLADARRQLHQAQRYQASRSTDSKANDWLVLEQHRRERLAAADQRATRDELARVERVATYTQGE